MPCDPPATTGTFAPGQSLANDLLRNSGLLRRDGQHKTFFLHLTLQEYLVGCAPARAGDRPDGWQHPLSSLDGAPTLEQLVDRKAWDGRWREVLALLAGKLRDPAPLLHLLEEERRDDCFRHRLALAVYCLSDVPERVHFQNRPLLERITCVIFDLCWTHAGKETASVVEHLLRELPSLERAGGHTRQDRAYSQRCVSISNPPTHRETHVRNTALQALDQPRSSNEPMRLVSLLPLLGDREDVVRWGAANALGRLSSTGCSDHITALLPLLGESEGCAYVREAALKALDELARDATVEHVALVMPLLHHTTDFVREAVVRALAPLAPAVQPEHLTALLPLLQDTDPYVRIATAQTLRRLAPCAEAQHVAAMFALLKSTDSSLNELAARVMRGYLSAGWRGISATSTWQ